MTSNLLSTVQTLYNDPELSDIKIIINNEAHFLMTKFIKTAAPKLYKTVDLAVLHAAMTQAPRQVTELSPDEAINQLVSVLSQKTQKKYITVTFTLTTVSRDTVVAVLESLYGKTIQLSLENLDEIHQLATIFGMKDLIAQCTQFLQEQIAVFKKTAIADAFVNAWKKTMENKSPLHLLYHNAIVENLLQQPKERILELTGNFEFDTLKEYLKSETLTCGEDLVYEIVKNWTASHTVTENQIRDLFSMVKLELLSVDYLMTKVKLNVDGIPYETYVKALEGSAKRLFGDTQQSNSSRSEKKSPMPKLDHTKLPVMFGLGKHNALYPGFHQVTKEEVDTQAFKHLFKGQHFRHNGLHVFDDFNADIICCQSGIPLALGDGRWFRFGNCSKGGVSLQKNTIRLAHTSASDAEYVKKSIDTICVANKSTGVHVPCDADSGLFVVNWIKF